MTRDELVEAMAKAAHKRDATKDWDASDHAYVHGDPTKDWESFRLMYLRDAEAVLEAIETAGWTVVPQKVAQALEDSTAVGALIRLASGRA